MIWVLLCSVKQIVVQNGVNAKILKRKNDKANPEYRRIFLLTVRNSIQQGRYQSKVSITSNPSLTADINHLRTRKNFVSLGRGCWQVCHPEGVRGRESSRRHHITDLLTYEGIFGSGNYSFCQMPYLKYRRNKTQHILTLRIHGKIFLNGSLRQICFINHE